MESEHDEPKQAAQEALEDNVTLENKTPGIGRGKVFLGLAVAAVVIVSAYLATRRGALTPATGSATSAAITLVTSDRADVDCVSAKDLNGLRCGFSTEIANWQGDEQNKLKPFFTTDRRMYLIPGLFLEPAVAARYRSEPPNKPREQLKRFTAQCQIKVIGKLAGVRTHWIANAAWSDPQDIDVATVSSCKIEG